MARSVRRRDAARMRWNVRIDVRDAKTGRLLRTERLHNLVVTTGLNLIRNYLAGSAVYPTEFHVGTDATAVNASQTALVAEVFDDTFTQIVSSTDATVVYKYFLASPSANGNTLREIGLFTSTGVMLARAVLVSPIVKTSTVTVTFTWTIALTAV